jgi:ATP-dependent RNA helicase DeaD
MTFPTIHPALDRALAEQGYVQATPVQLAVLEADADGRDLLVSAQTGSGKTVAFGLALASTLLDGAEILPQAGAPLALVVAPTRELAMQVHRELTWLYAHAGGRLVACVGGMDPRREARQLAAGCHIVVGTPGRLRDHLERGALDASGLKAVVLDEADEMLDLGFREDLEFILDAAPTERRTLLFSATIARDIAALAARYQRDSARIDTIDRSEPHADIEYRAVRVAPNEVEHAVVNLLRWHDASRALVFCSTREAVNRLHASLAERGFPAVALSGEMTQAERNRALQALRDGRAKVCVATDVAARGLDLPDLGLVLHADLPLNRDTLLHRSGRTGRAGKKGVSVLLAPLNRRRRAEQLLAAAGVDAVWDGPPPPEAIRERDQERLLADPVLVEETTEEEAGLAKALLAERSPEQVAAALIRLYRAGLPSPEEVFDPGPGRERERGGPMREREDVAPRYEDDEVVWFRLNVGRAKNADPKWLLPLICRLGHVTKRDIGKIRIFDRDTRFGIAREAAGRFAEAVAGAAEGGVRITPADGDFGQAERPRPRFERAERPERAPRPERAERGPRPPRHEAAEPAPPSERPRGRPHGEDQAYEKPRFEKPKFEKPKGAKPRFDRPAAEEPRAEKPRFEKPAKPRFDPLAERDESRPFRRERPAAEAPRPAERAHAKAKPRVEARAAEPRWTGKKKPAPARPGAKPFKPKKTKR